MAEERWLNRTVWGMAFTSFLSDLGHEAQSTLLPSFMAALGLPPPALGAEWAHGVPVCRAAGGEGRAAGRCGLAVLVPQVAAAVIYGPRRLTPIPGHGALCRPCARRAWPGDGKLAGHKEIAAKGGKGMNAWLVNAAQPPKRLAPPVLGGHTQTPGARNSAAARSPGPPNTRPPTPPRPPVPYP